MTYPSPNTQTLVSTEIPPATPDSKSLVTRPLHNPLETPLGSWRMQKKIFFNQLPAYANWKRFTVFNFLRYMVLHLSLFLVPFTYSMQGLIAFFVFYFISICFGITLGYHRLLAHQSYKTNKWIKYTLAFCGMLACQRGPIWWVATHRLHHSKVDQPLDPHTPQVSFLWAHFIWAFFRHPQLDETPETVNRLARDLWEDRGMRFLENNYALMNTAVFGALFATGYWLGGFKMGLSLFVWGGLFRLVVTLHITWLVNSVAHLWGYRRYETADTSRNNWWVALLTFGEGWHNNHHAQPRSAKMGFTWFEIDVTYWFIALMQKVGLARQVIQPKL